MEIYNLIGIDPTALEPIGLAPVQSGSWLTNTPASEKAAKFTDFGSAGVHRV